MSVPLTTLIGLLGALQGLVLAGAVVSLKGAMPRPNRALALLLFVFSISVGTIVAEHANLWGAARWLVVIEYTFSFLFPPALWYYANVVLGIHARSSLALHLLPFIGWIGYLLAIGLGGVTEGPFGGRWMPPILLVVVYLAAYTVAVGVRVGRIKSRPKTLVSHGVVLRTLIVLLLLLHAAQGLRYLFRDVAALADIVPLTGTLIVYTLSVLAFRQSRLFAGVEPTSRQEKYESSTLTPEQAAAIQQRLLDVMTQEKPFMNENLNLADLAARLAVPRAHLSQVINANLESSFPQLLNEYRVNEALQLLADADLAHLTIEAIGYEVGFRSRSAFHSAFKRITGETPSQARLRLS